MSTDLTTTDTDAAKAEIIAFMRENYLQIENSLEAELMRRGLSAFDFRLKNGRGKYSGGSNRIAKAWEILERGGIKWPAFSGGPFLVDSQQADTGNYAYTVYAATVPGHGGNQCNCTDSAYRASLTCNSICKHILTVMLWYIGCAMFAASHGRADYDKERLRAKAAEAEEALFG